MSFHSLPLTERTLKATEARLERLYEAARLGLKGDNLAYAADMLPVELRRLAELDPLARAAIEKGAADGERAMAATLYNAALEGDTKAALEVLKHRHDWVAKQQVQIDISQQISITAALEQAQMRVIESVVSGTIDEAPERANARGPLTITDERASNGYAENITRGRTRASALRPG